MRLRVLVVSDVRIVQEGVHSVLSRERGVDVVYTVEPGCAREHSDALHPDVVLIDAAGGGCVEAVRDLLSSSPSFKVVAFGLRENGEELLALAAAGTAAYVRNSAEPGEIVRVLEQCVAAEPIAASSAAPAGGRPRFLSQRELQIAHLINRGLSNKQIARQLGIGVATAKNHVHNLCRKLRVHRRGEAAARLRALLRTRVPAALARPEGSPAP